jgi:hypothetical protein
MSFSAVVERNKNHAGPTSFWSLFSLSFQCQAREIGSFSPLSLFDISLFYISLVPSIGLRKVSNENFF